MHYWEEKMRPYEVVVNEVIMRIGGKNGRVLKKHLLMKIDSCTDEYLIRAERDGYVESFTEDFMGVTDTYFRRGPNSKEIF